MNDYADLIWRLENGADRFLKWTYNEPYSGAPVISIPRHPDNIDALLTEAAACIREMVEWRPIETAPRDAVIMLFGLLDPHPSDREAHAQLDKPKRFTGYWDEVDEAWCPVGSTWTGPWIIPTHWLPLPPAPGAEA